MVKLLVSVPVDLCVMGNECVLAPTIFLRENMSVIGRLQLHLKISFVQIVLSSLAFSGSIRTLDVDAD